MFELRCSPASDDRNALSMRGQMQLQMAPAGESKQPRFTINAYNGGIIRPDRPYLDAPLIIELAGVTSPPRIAAILNHDDWQVVGQTERVKIGRNRIDMEGIVTGPWDRPGTPAETVVTHAKNGMVWQVSLGAAIEKMEFLQDGVETRVNGSLVRGPLYVARRIRLRHISFLSDGADQTASATIAAKAAGENAMNFHEWLKALGFEDPAAIPDAQREKLQAKFDEEQRLAAAAKKPKPKPAAPAGNDDDEEEKPPRPRRLQARRSSENGDPLAVHKLRRDRREGILKLMAQFADDYPDAIEDIEAHGNTALEDENWTVKDFENLLLRECTRFQRIDNRQRSERSERVPDQQMIEAGLCMSSNLRSETLEKCYDARTLEMAHNRWRSRLTISQVLMLAARANGVTVESHHDVLALLRGAFQGDGRLAASGPSTIDLSGILSNVANKFLLDGFNYVPQEWRKVARIRTVNDFKEISTYRLVGNGTFQKVGSSGELKHGTLGEIAYGNKADTYGIILGLNRQDLINDDLGALTGAASELGLGAGGSLNDVFWAEFLDNATFFTAARGNYDEGADTALTLTLTALQLAELLFMQQTKPNGKPLGVRPKILLVPPELYRTALALVRSTLVVAAGQTDAVIPNANTFVGAFEPVMVEQLSNSTFTGYSALAWYLTADPMTVATIEIVFVGGKQTPTVEQASANFDQLGIQMRGFLDFGCRKQEYRGGVKMKGEA